MNNTNAPAAALAANFQVSELEPRLENAWIESPVPTPLPGPGEMQPA